jgi:hypothetical protein
MLFPVIGENFLIQAIFMTYLKKIIFFFVFLLPLAGLGQFRPGLDDRGEGEVEKKAKEKNITPRVISWKKVEYGAFTDSVRVDTVLRNYHNYNPVYKNSLTASYTGNYGGAYLDNDFSKRESDIGFYFLRTHDAYLLTPARICFYNTTTPYTLLDYSQSENKNLNNETRLNVLHSQNINPELNVTFRYDMAKSDGQYNFQKNHNHFITLYSGYSGEKLNLSGGFIFNRITNGENGGMINDDDLLNTETKYVSMQLTDARSEYKNTSLFAEGEYKLGRLREPEDTTSFTPFAGILCSVHSSRNFRLFSEGETDDNSGYFPVSYMNQDFSHDSVRFNTLTSLIQLKFYESEFRKYSFGKRVFAGVELTGRSFASQGYGEPVFPFHKGRYSRYTFASPVPRWDKKSYFNTFIGGGIFRESGKFWTWNFEGKQYLSGFKLGQTELDGVISKPVHLLKDSLSLIRISGNIWNRVPDYFQQKYFSNRIAWNNNLNNEQRMNASFAFFSPKYNLEAGAKYSLINNYIYHDTLGIPAQTRNELLVLSGYVNKEFEWGPFYILSQFLWQKASAPQYVHLPELSARILLSYNMVLAKVLFVQLGADTRYNTLYYADAYHPVTGFFYLQNKKKLGNYPYIDAFANLKLKRTRFFFQYMNVGSLFLNEPYFTVLHHPMYRATFRLGVAWSFYN